MINKWVVVIALLMTVGCADRQKKIMQATKDEGLLQEKTVNGFVLKMQYMSSEDKELLHFVVNITESNGSPVKGADNNMFSYGLDSLFGIVNVTDTLHPVDVIRVANGGIGGVQYMVLFDRPAAYSDVNLFLFFRDRLFTQQFITFPLKGSAINRIDYLRWKQ
ncbi:hypothetical protein SAMN05518672_103445 [Chitinophaga sp. CF118]|uniref:hypothetical protein n=1 Tax=Chitinophaga sp. CF118 TaxID=1884367 RepID=UPI0008E2887D|nr:hypothetical protein [Chitinophaga sp. CF118]SFD83850.1 hypothetical protein SAMN05518672_103445 [Chitinophaga sp. CF118]